MSKPDYTAFDAELLLLIKSGKNRMMMLDGNKLLLEMAKPFCAGTASEPWRIIDRRLQALRKAGKIRHDGAVWEIVSREGR